MPTLHPAFPTHRPLTSAHRAGNNLIDAESAVSMGLDLIETDIWLHNNRLEIRHRNTMGPIPLLWDRWSLRPGWGPRLLLQDLLEATPGDAILFLDLKGEELELGAEILQEVRSLQPGRRIAMCGRNWPQLDPIVNEPDVSVVYSVGDEKERAAVLPRLEAMQTPAMSIHRKLVTPDFMARVKELGTTVIGWDVETSEQLRWIVEMGVDGFTSDNRSLLANVAQLGMSALDD